MTLNYTFKHWFYVLFITCVFSSTVYGQKAWQYLGPDNITGTEARSTVIHIDNNNVPFMAYRSAQNGYKVTVVKFDQASSQWAMFDSTGIPGNDGALELVFTTDGNNTMYLAFTYFPNNISTIAVLKYDNTQSQWVSVGSLGFIEGSDISLDFDMNNVPYLAYRKNGANVKKFEQGQWVNVGSPNFTNNNGTLLKMDMHGNTPYVAYQEVISGSLATSVMKYDQGQWTRVGAAGFASSAIEHSFAVAPNGTPYLAFKDADNNFEASVMKYDQGQWTVVGSAGFSTSSISNIEIAINSNNVPYVGYQDNGNQFKASVLTFDNAQSNWVPVGTLGFSASSTGYNTIAFDGNDRPFVAFQTQLSYGSVMVFDNPLSVDENSLSGQVSIFPNPAKNNLSIQFKNSSDNTAISIYSVTGKLVFSTELKKIEANETLPLPIDRFESGTYVLEITNENGVFRDKIILNK